MNSLAATAVLEYYTMFLAKCVETSPLVNTMVSLLVMDALGSSREASEEEESMDARVETVRSV